MWQKEYGRTGKKVSVVSMGCMRFPNPEDIDGMADIVMHAYERGINYFDTAPTYCGQKSEVILGTAVKQMKPGTFFISTKSNKAKGSDLRRDLETSLERLNVERIDFFHIWYVLTQEAWAQRKAGGALAEALKAKEEGLIEHLVMSSHMPSEELKGVLNEGYFEGVTLGYCAINFPYREDAVEASGKMGLGVVTMNPLAGGLIPRNAERFRFIQGPQDRSVVEAAIRFNVSNPNVTSALVGFSNKAQVDEAVGAGENFEADEKGRVDAIREQVRESFGGLCTGCGYCLPCPEEIAVPKMMDAYNMKILSGGEDRAILDRLKWHWSLTTDEARKCILCGQCEARCTQHLPIRERMEEISAAKESEND